MKKIFVIYEEIGTTNEDKGAVYKYVDKLKKNNKVHFPFRDTPKEDEIGFNIRSYDRKKMIDCDEVHIWYHPKNNVFNLGMAFALEKPIKLINKLIPTEVKSFGNILLYITGNLDYKMPLNFKEDKEIEEEDCIESKDE